MQSRSSPFCALLMLSNAALLLVGGCSSAGPGQGGSPTLKQTRMRVEGPMLRYRNEVTAGAVTLAERQRVDAAYKNFQQAYAAALQAAGSNEHAPTPDNLKALANQVVDAVAAIPM